MINICILTKPRFLSDLDNLLEWYVLNREALSIRKITVFCNFPWYYTFQADFIEFVKVQPYEGFHKQKELYTEYMKRCDIPEGDYAIFLDDDEYLYYDAKVYGKNLSQLFDEYSRVSYKVPEILMSTKVLSADRGFANMPDFCCMRRDDKSSQVKTFVKYMKSYTYDYVTKISEEHLPLHTPLINGNLTASILYDDEKDGSLQVYDDSSSYAETDYEFPLRIYHYHIKSYQDWQYKLRRGSAASGKPWYQESIYDNIFFGGYDTEDTTIKDAFYKLRNELK